MLRSVLCMFAALFSALAQDAPAVAIAGRTIDDVHGEAVQNVRLFLTGGTLQDPLVAKSSSEGKFSFPVPDGHYQMTMEKAGYLPFAPEDLDVRGARVYLGDIVLAAKRTISGKITWSDGEPAVDLIVAAHTLTEGHIDNRGGLPAVRTDDRGIFQITGLSQGHYLVVPSSLDLPGGRSIAPFSYTLDLVEASEARVAVALEERTGVDVQAKVAVSENVPAGTRVTVELHVPGQPAVTSIGGGGKAGETFVMPRVPAGTYQAVAVRQLTGEVQYGVQTLHVGNSPISDWTISIPENQPLTGSLEIEGDQNPAPTVTIRAHCDKFDLDTMQARSTAQGEFRLLAALPGESYSLSFLTMPPDLYVGSVRQGEQTLTRDPFLVTAGGGPIRILLKKDGGKITGQLPSVPGLSRSAFLVLAPTDRGAKTFYRTVSSDRKRAFQITGIAPGEYDLFAFDREGDYQGEESLKRYAARAVHVAVEPNASQAVQLDIANRR